MAAQGVGEAAAAVAAEAAGVVMAMDTRQSAQGEEVPDCSVRGGAGAPAPRTPEAACATARRAAGQAAAALAATTAPATTEVYEPPADGAPETMETAARREPAIAAKSQRIASMALVAPACVGVSGDCESGNCNVAAKTRNAAGGAADVAAAELDALEDADDDAEDAPNAGGGSAAAGMGAGALTSARSLASTGW